MTQDEVQLAIGEPDRVSNESGRVTWTYVRSTGKLLVVNFDLAGRVSKYVVDPNGKQPKAAAPQRQVKRSSQAAWNTSASTPIK
jgi:outer membrane protein assembly factor BamE (lipoprotein component of BamABCDE complex)